MKFSVIKRFSMIVIGTVVLMSATTGDGAITKNGKQVIVNTTTIAANIKGYNGPTPLKIYISNNKIEKIEALPNDETPKYFFKVKKSLVLRPWMIKLRLCFIVKPWNVRNN